MTRITETKSVKVDNWGVFFLQKLQNFFNKTDHCDLTLQFNDNSQLKVHRLVLSACTDYFNMLESTCEMYDDVLIMPLDLQADVIVPIVNFMYTGTLEFQYNMYEKLLKTARDMNMTVLLKLLEAHKQTTRMVQGGRQPVVLNKQAPTPRPRTNAQSGVTYQMPASVARSYGSVKQIAQSRPVQRLGQVSKTTIAPLSTGYATNKSMSIPEPRTLVQKYGAGKESQPGPSRFEETGIQDTLEGSFDDISYESKPLVTADQIKKEEETSPFEKLRKGYTNVNLAKRPAPTSFSTPAAKKPNLDEVKEFTEAARLRSQIAAEDDDSPGFADDTHFDDDDDDGEQQTQQLPTKASPHTSRQIIIKQEQKSSPGSSGSVKQITVKDESGNVDHAKIISEVLKKYPHLVKKNKNIKLKIMQKTSTAQSTSGGQGQSATAGPLKMEVRTATPLKTDISMVRKATEVARAPAPNATSTPAPKKIDSKTMHALIAKGAENMTGPWLCLRCGIDGRPISIPSYKAFRNHLIVKHKEKIDARICEHCGWKAEQRNPHLFYHWLTEHNIKSTIKFPVCSECGHVAMNAPALQKHEEENHQRGDLQQCIYCNKVFAKEMDLYEHMKSLHKQRARDDGVIDFSDDEYHVEEEEEEEEEDTTATPNTSQEKQIKVLSNISITNNRGIPFVIDHSQAQTVSQIGGKSQIQLQQITLEPSSEAEALSNVASGIATSLGLVDSASVVIEDHNFPGQYIEHQMATVHGETGTTTTVTATGPDQLTKLITEDGTELQLTQSQKEEIFSQLQNSGNGGNVVMVLNDENFISGTGLHLEDGTQLISSAASTGHNSNIVVMYTQAEPDHTTHSTVTTTAPVTTTVASTVTSENMEHHEEVEAAEEGASKGTAAVATEDETSQASTQPSEKASEKDSENQQMEVDAENSQHDADLSESADAEDSKHEEEEEEKAAKEREKLKLISELEGDWSEDTEEHPVATEQKEEAKEPASKSVEQEPEKQTEQEIEKEPISDKSKTAAAAAEKPSKANEKEISQLLDDWNSETKLTENDSDADLEKKLEKVVGEKHAEHKDENKEEKETEMPMETSAADNTADSVDSSMNENDTHVVVLAAESETETSMKEDDADNSQEEKPAEKQKKLEPESKNDTTEEDQDDPKEDEEDKAKSKEVVSSLLGDWDEDDDL
ncbi:centrosome-associated zinc finger protein Cp190 [Ochlerotatus camptorhynchus]|uniref:centrosome-associated zinc finger protein Cp190 n=1 Tax=Ochlerotatus camptorhynchus TaxID=644619 RepID=UPI0031CF53EA